MNKFFKATINDKSIYVKVDAFVHNDLVEYLMDNNYTISSSSPKEWDDNIDFGISYELHDYLEFEEFKENNKKEVI